MRLLEDKIENSKKFGNVHVKRTRKALKYINEKCQETKILKSFKICSSSLIVSIVIILFIGVNSCVELVSVVHNFLNAKGYKEHSIIKQRGVGKGIYYVLK